MSLPLKSPVLVSLILIAITSLMLAGCATSHGWEYRTRTTKKPVGKSVLDGYGKSGWELVGYSCRPKGETNFEYEYVFKRAK